MARDDWKRRFADEFHSNPIVATTILGAAGALLGLMLAAQNSTPEARRAFKQRQTERKREYVRNRRARDRDLLRSRLQREYFASGPGRELLRRQGLIVFPAGDPFPDGTFETFEASGMRRSIGGGFVAASASAGARLRLTHDTSEGPGGFNLHRPDGSSLIGEYGSLDPLSVYDPLRKRKPEQFAELIEDAGLMARLIAAPGSTLRQVSLKRPDYAQIRDAIWKDHLRENPHIAAVFQDK